MDSYCKKAIKKLIIYTKLFIANIIIFTLIEIIFLRLFDIVYEIVSLIIGTVIGFVVYGTYGNYKREKNDISRPALYFWGMILPLIYGYFIYYFTWRKMPQSDYVTPEAFLDTVYIEEGYIKGYLMTFLLNPLAAYGFFTRVFVLILSLLFRIWKKESRSKETREEDNESWYSQNETYSRNNNKSESQEEQKDDQKDDQKEEEDTFKWNENENSRKHSPDDNLFFKGVETVEDLKSRYYALMKIYHPDNSTGNNEATLRITQEYEKLKKLY